MSESFAKGNKAFVNEDYEGALEQYTAAISAEPNNAEYFISRSIAQHRLGHYALALTDASSALQNAKGPKGTRALLAKAQFRRALALVELGRTEKAADALREARKAGFADKKAWAKWAEKAGIPVDEIAAVSPSASSDLSAASDLPTVSDLPVASDVSAPFSTSTSAAESSTTVPVSAPNPASTAASEPKQISPVAPFLAPAKIRHEWFQNENFVTVSIFIKGLPRDDPNVVKIDYHERSLSVTIKLPSGSDFMLELDPLFAEIIPKDCKHATMSTKVEIKLKKAVLGIKWADLEALDGNPSDALQTISAAPAAGAPAYPSSSKKKHDWDSLVKNFEEDKPEGEAALHALFKNIYKDASEDTRRAMVKSYQESGGTTLSTNWEEIGKGEVKVSPPEGMVAKKFEI
ncbi:Protein SGT1 A [Physocladia obscura]|uniref:Protein SGT1 A n=1 Tax=Physocladia obscura TaxID=109957 RepID=A0AAD5XEL7_9FUNG|nr:Protein SGT1 A [Physocladia obscura]